MRDFGFDTVQPTGDFTHQNALTGMFVVREGGSWGISRPVQNHFEIQRWDFSQCQQTHS